MRPVFFFPHATIIDCGASRATLAVFSCGRKGRLRLERHAAVQLNIGAGQEGSWLEKTTAALPALRAQVEPSGPVIVVLPPHLTLLKMLNTPRVEAAKRDKIINFEGQQSIPYPLTEVVWDRLITGENSHSFNVLLCAAKIEILDPLCAAVAAAGMVPSVLLPSARALAAGFREIHPESAGPALLVNLGARSTTLVLMEDGKSFQARSFSLGGNSVTQQWADALACDFAQAEEAKQSRSHADQIAPVVRTFANRLAQEIIRTLVYFRRPLSAEVPLRVILTGGTARLPGLAGFLATQLHVPVSVFEAAGGIEFAREAGDFTREEHGAPLADLVGAAALQLRAGQVSLNLLPPRLRHQAGRRKLRPWMAVAAGLAVAAVIPAVAHQRQVLSSARAQNAELERALVPLRASDARRQEYRQRREEAQRQRAAWLRIAAARTGWLRLLGEMQTRFIQTGDVWLERVQVLPVPTGSESAQAGGGGPPYRVAFSGQMRPKERSETTAGADTYQRVRKLLEQIAEAPPVAAVESERFESVPPGGLRFDFVIVLKEPAALKP